MNKYKGKICPFCKTSFLEDDEVVVCDICEMPHHKDCWFENGQCTTFGCTGKIKDLLPFDQNSASVVIPTQSQAQSQPQAQTTFVPPAQPQAQAAFVPPAQSQQTYSAPAAQPQQQSFAFCIYCGNKYVIGDMFCRKCGKKIQNAAPISKEEQDKRDYEQAVKLLEAQRFDEALQIFTKLADYSDSKEKANLCVQGKENARKKRLYLSATAVLSKQRISDTEIKSAIETLTSIADYKDSKAKISDLEKMLEKWYEAKKAAEEAARKRQYETAVSYVSSGLFDEAIKIFTDLGEYADCKAQIEKTLKAKETARKEQLYTKSLAVLTADALTENDLKDAIEALKSIEDYKDSKEKIPEVEARLEKWYEDKAAAEEAERIRKAKARAKAKKITILSSIAAVFVAIIIVGIVFVTKTYNIVYDLDGGTIENANESSYTLLTNDITLGKPSKEGYTFIGWTGTDLETPTLDVTISKWSLGNRDYKANWQANSYTITFDTVGGVGSESQSVTFDANTELPTPTKNGYTFAGWYVGDKLYSNGDWKDATDLTLTAKWTAITYNITYDDTADVKANVVVTFNPNYSGSTNTTTTLTNGQTLTYPTVPTRSGYAFVGWYTDSSCTTKYNFSGTITENITLYAKWSSMTSSYNTREYVDIANYNSSSNKKTFSASSSYSSSKDYYYFTCYTSGSYTIYAARTSGDFYITVYNATQGSTIMSKYNLYGSSSSKSASFTANAGDVIYVSLYKYSSYDSAGAGTFYVSGAGYPTSTATVNCNTVEGYVYDSTSTIETTVTFGSDYTLPTPIRTGYSFLGWYNGETKVESGDWSIASDVTLTAKWEAGKNTITLNANGGTVSNTSVPVTYGSAYTLPTPTRTGYTFDGWFSGSTQYVSGTWNGQTDITLVAQWTVKTYNLTLSNTERKDIVVTFDNNYSGSTPTTVTLEDGETLSYPTEPTRSGYAFIGWFTDSSCTTRYNFTGTISDDMTLYAGWKQISFTNQYTKVEVDPTEYTSSSDYLGLSTSGTNSSYKRYVYFVAEEAGTHYIYYANSTSSSSYKYYLYIYNLTTGSTIKSNATVSSTSYSSASFTCSAGDVIVMAVYKYSSSSYYESTAYFYFDGFSSVTSSAVAEAEDYLYSTTSNYSEQVTYGTSFTLPTPTRTGYRFLGWYNGNNKVDAGTWNYDYNLTLTPKWQEIVYYNVTFNNATQAVDKINVTYNYNYSGSTNTVVELSNGDTLTYPAVPTRSGYAFAGWYTNSSCTTPYDFSGTITEDTTLYADWVSMQSSTYGSEYLNIANYTSSSQQKSVTASSYSSYNYYYFTCYKDGTYTIYATWTEGDFKFNVSNVTKGTTIISDYNLYSSQTSTSQSFTASAGDVICVRTTRYSSSYNYTSNGKFYVSGVSYPTSTAVAQCSETSGAEYSYGSSFTVQVGYGEEFILPTITRAGYTFLGWYNGSTKVESGNWNIASNVTLTPKWQ